MEFLCNTLNNPYVTPFLGFWYPLLWAKKIFKLVNPLGILIR
jgi:hypothetical protein